MKRNLFTNALLGLLASVSVNAQQPPPLQLNVAYHCPGNTIVVVKHCEVRGGTDVCSLLKGVPSGPLGDEISMPKAQAAALGLICTTQGSPVSQAAARPGGREFNPSYLSEMPSPDRVLAAMKTSDPRETALRQIWAFYELNEIIKTLSGPREFARTGMLPDEQKILGDYQVAQYKVGQAADKAFPNDKPSEDLTYHFARWDPQFGFKGINIWQFFSEGLQSQFAQIIGKDNARYAALRAEQMRIAAQGVSANPQAVPEAQQGMKNDPGRVAMRRCIESGRSEMDCLGEGLKVGLNDLAGGDIVSNITEKTAPQGLRLSGSYSGFAGNKLHIAFSQDKATVGCGALVWQTLPYVVERIGNQISVKVPISPKPLVVSFRTDNTLAGPPDIVVNGMVPVGRGGGGGASAPAYQEQTNTTTRERQIDAGEARNYEGTDAVHQNGMEYSVTEQVTTTTYEPTPVAHYQPVPMAPKTERCIAGVMQGSSNSGNIGEALTQIVDPSAKKKAAVPPGLRLAGLYAGQSGLRIEFREDTATVECGEAHVAEPYVVQDTNGQVSIRIQNGAAPFALSLQPKGTLVGSGTIDVAGRIVTGSTENALTYASRNARCAIGTLVARHEN